MFKMSLHSREMRDVHASDKLEGSENIIQSQCTFEQGGKMVQYQSSATTIISAYWCVVTKNGI